MAELKRSAEESSHAFPSLSESRAVSVEEHSTHCFTGTIYREPFWKHDEERRE
jgi:hypothetical protein